MRLFIDNNLPPGWAVALNALFQPHGDHVEHLRDRFPGAATDAAWIKALGGEGDWVVLSGDIRVAKKRPSRELFVGAGLVGFFFTPKSEKQPAHLRFARVLLLWDLMKNQVRSNPNGCFELPPTGKTFRPIGR